MFGQSKEEKDEVVESEVLRKLEAEQGPIYTYCMRFKFDDSSIHEDIYNIVVHMVESQQLPPAEQEKVCRTERETFFSVLLLDTCLVARGNATRFKHFGLGLFIITLASTWRARLPVILLRALLDLDTIPGPFLPKRRATMK